MHIALSPKENFQLNDDAAREFRALTGSYSVVLMALESAVSEYVIKQSPTTEEMNGVRKFLNVFLNMAEVLQAAPPSLFQSIQHVQSTAQPKPIPAKK